MKKIHKAILITIICFAALGIAAAIASNLSTPLNEVSTIATTKETTTIPTTTTTVPSTTTTTSATTASTTEATTAAQKETDPIIDINNLSIIDLYPLSLSGGDWDVKHCQGIAVDKENGFIYYSYTTMLIKCSFEGKIVASVTGIKGHMGDITYNAADGMLYCGYYSEGRTGFYIYIFNTKKINKMNMKPSKDIVRSVYVREAYEDYLGSVDFENEDGTKTTFAHRYGCSGIDGVTMGPDFLGKEKKKEYLTVAYGTYSETKRTDNNYQVLLQYDVSSWWSSYGQSIANSSHRVGPEKCGKFFLYTGNTYWGTQTMEYFDEFNIWILNCYKSRNPKFKPYTMFAIDGDLKPKKKKLEGQPKSDKQYVLSHYTDGEYDKKHNVWGWYNSYGVQGIAYMGDGLFYITRPYKSWTGKKLAISYLNVWKKSDGAKPFTLSVNVANDYTVKKAKHIVITTTAPPTTAPETTKPQTNIIDRIFDFLG